MEIKEIQYGEGLVGKPEVVFEKFLVSSAETLASEKHPEHNEDAVINRPDLGLFGVFDGVGGGERGGAASRAAKDYIVRFFEKLSERDVSNIKSYGWKNVLERAMREASAELKKLRSGRGSPDTTATVMKILKEGKRMYLVYGSIGDSRLYIKRTEDLFLRQVSDDDDLLKYEHPDIPQEERQQIEQALANASKSEDLLTETSVKKPLYYFFERRAGISKALSDLAFGDSLQAGIMEVGKGDIAIVTSDGIHDNLTYGEIQEIVAHAKNPKSLAKSLVKASQARSRLGRDENIRAKPDDISAVAVEIK